MLSFSCVHCGQRMTVTEDADQKRACCDRCGQVVVIPDGASGVRLRRKPKALVRTPVQTPPPERELGSSSDNNKRSIHQQMTRAEGAPVATLFTTMLAPPQADDELGRLGGYRILGVIGSGGMGVVFRAEDPLLERLVALKAMLPNLAANDTARARFLREARSAAGLWHDHIVPIYQVGEDRGVPFIAMPLLQGEPLDKRLNTGHLEPLEQLRIAREMAVGLDVIHKRGLVHRDIKPANVWLESETGRVKILDFGLARAAAGDNQLTHDGAVVGSPAYMAPEQAARRGLDARADLFSLGCVMYVMATGKLPFDADDALATMLAVANSEPTPPGELNPDLPAEIEELIEQLLSKNPDDRPPTARAVIERIRRIEGCLL